MPVVDVEVVLRVPEGEEMTDERMETLADMGFDDAQVLFRRRGQVVLVVGFEEENWEREAESQAEDLVEAMPDADLYDIRLAD